MVQKGTTGGEVGLIVGRVFVVLLGVTVAAVFYYSQTAVVQWLRRQYAAIRAAGEARAAPPPAAPLELAHLPTAANKGSSSSAAAPPLHALADAIHVDAAGESAGTSANWPPTPWSYL